MYSQNDIYEYKKRKKEILNCCFCSIYFENPKNLYSFISFISFKKFNFYILLAFMHIRLYSFLSSFLYSFVFIIVWN